MSSFSDALSKEVSKNFKSSNGLKIDVILEQLRKDGKDEEADVMEKSILDESLPVYTIFKAMNNSGYYISYGAVRTARQRKLQGVE